MSQLLDQNAVDQNAIDKLPKFQQIQYQFSKHLRNPAQNHKTSDIEDRRMKIYRDLFYNNVEGFCSNSFPILRSLTSDEKWHRMVRSFYADFRCESPYFIDISKEFLDYLMNVREPEADDYPFTLELAHWEWMEVNAVSDLGNILEFPHDRNGDLFSQKVVVSPLAWPIAYQFPVHKIGDAYIPDTAPDQPSFLIISRNRAHQVDFMETNPMTYRLLEILQEKETTESGASAEQKTGQEAIAQLQQELNYPEPQQLIEGGKQILQDLLKRDVILGVNS